MTTLNQAKEAILLKFSTDITPGTKYLYENEDWPPDGQPAHTESWLRLTVRNATSQQETLGPVGNRRWERRAILFIQVFTPAGGAGGTRTGDLLARTAAVIFEGITLDGMAFYAALIREIGRENNTWYHHSVEIPFTYYETR